MNGLCHLCGKTKGLTTEHIIPQCLGGVLSDLLYCSDCNGVCGRSIDLELARQFGRYATLLQVHRARGKNQPFTVVTEDGGETLRFDGKSLQRDKPRVTYTRDHTGRVTEVEAVARTEKELKSIVDGVARKYNLNPDSAVFDRIEHPPPRAHREIVLANPLIHRAIAKIAYGFACTKLPMDLILQAPFDGIRKFILGKTDEPFASSNYAHTNFMVDNIRPLHKVHLTLNKRDRTAIGYVALFGTFRYTVLLAEELRSNIQWPAIDYTYNPATKREVGANVLFQAPLLSKEDIVNPKQSRNQVLACLRKGHKMLAEYSSALEEFSVEAIDDEA